MNELYVGVIYRHWRIDSRGSERSYIGKHAGNNVQKNRWGIDGKKYAPKKGEKPTHFWYAIAKYGWNNFHHDIVLKIECSTKKDLDFWLDTWEKYYIEKYDSYNNGYNMTLGGDGFTTETSMRLWNDEHYRQDRVQGTKELWKDSRYRQRQIETHNTNEFKQRMIDSIGKKVMCLNTGEVFDCVRQAAAWCGLSKKGDGDIGRCCKGKRKTAGKHPITGERLRWKFV